LNGFEDSRIPPLLRTLLDSRELRVRDAAADQLIERGDTLRAHRIVQITLESNTGHDFSYPLGRHPNPEIMRQLIATLEHAQGEAAQRGVEILTNLRDPSTVDFLLQGLKKETWPQAEVGRALQCVAAHLQEVVTKTPDADAPQRRQAETLLRRMADETLALVSDSEAPCGRTHRQAVEVLAQLKERRAVEPLARALQAADPGARYKIAQALGRIGDPRAVEPLARLLADTERIPSLRHVPPRVCDGAAQALIEIGAPAVPAAVATLKQGHDPLTRCCAIGVLGGVGGAEARQALQAALADPDSRVRSRAQSALEWLKNVGPEKPNPRH